MGGSPLSTVWGSFRAPVWFPFTHRLGWVPVQPRIWGLTQLLAGVPVWVPVWDPRLSVGWGPVSDPAGAAGSPSAWPQPTQEPRSLSLLTPVCPHMVPCALGVPSQGFSPTMWAGVLAHCNAGDDSEHEEFFNTPANVWSMSESLLLSLLTSSQKSHFQCQKLFFLIKKNNKTNPKPQTPGFPQEVIPEMFLATRAVDGDLPSLTEVSLERWVLSLELKTHSRYSGVTPSDSPDWDCPHIGCLVKSSPSCECHSKITKNAFFNPCPRRHSRATCFFYKNRRKN